MQVVSAFICVRVGKFHAVVIKDSKSDKFNVLLRANNITKTSPVDLKTLLLLKKEQM